MENQVKLTKLASCAGCGAKVGAGTLCQLLDAFATHTDPKLLVGYDKSDDDSGYAVSEELAIVQTTDFFPPIVDDPFMYGQIAATNALSDVYAMGGEPKLALNIMCIPEKMEQHTVQEILRGGYAKAYEAGAIITGGHTIHGAEPIYGLAVTGFVHPQKVWRNGGAQPGDVLILTKPLGVGILTTAAKAELVEATLLHKLYEQMSTLNKYAHDVLVKYSVHACTDVTGFALLGHSLEMAQGSNATIHLKVAGLPYHQEAYEMASMCFIPAGAYRNREFAQAHVKVVGDIPLRLQDICYDPQTSGGLLCSIPQEEAAACLAELQEVAPTSAIIGYVSEKLDAEIYLE